jgi:hypothetical protein
MIAHKSGGSGDANGQTSLARTSPATPLTATTPPPPPSPAAPARDAQAVPAAAAVSSSSSSAAASTTAAGAVEGASDDMEQVDAKAGMPRGWNVQARYRPQVALLDEGGNHFLRLTNPDAGKIVYVDRKIKLEPSWVAVTVSARMRSSGFNAGSGSMQDGRVAVLFKDESNQRIGGYPTVPSVRGDSTWTVRTATADVPTGAKSLQLQAGIFNATGTVDFDDIIVTPQK